MTAASLTSPHSRIVAESGEIARTAGIAGAIQGYLPNRWPKWSDPAAARLGSRRRTDHLRSSARITEAGDVVAVPTPGHSATHVSVIVRDGEEQIVLAGDASSSAPTMLRGTIDGGQPGPGVVQRRRSPTSAPCAPPDP